MYLCFLFLQDRDEQIKDLSKQLKEDDKFSAMEFLRQLVFENPSFTDTLIDFESVGDLPDGEEFVECEEDIDNGEDETVNTTTSTDHSHVASTCGVELSTVSSPSQSSSQADTKRMCGICAERVKDSLMSCGHIICGQCFSGLIDARQKYCRENYRSKRQQLKEEKHLWCPFDLCRKVIQPIAHMLNFDF